LFFRTGSYRQERTSRLAVELCLMEADRYYHEGLRVGSEGDGHGCFCLRYVFRRGSPGMVVVGPNRQDLGFSFITDAPHVFWISNYMVSSPPQNFTYAGEMVTRPRQSYCNQDQGLVVFRRSSWSSPLLAVSRQPRQDFRAAT
jgi:hypothetical protein